MMALSVQGDEISRFPIIVVTIDVVQLHSIVRHKRVVAMYAFVLLSGHCLSGRAICVEFRVTVDPIHQISVKRTCSALDHHVFVDLPFDFRKSDFDLSVG